MRWLEAAFALHKDDFFVTKEMGSISHEKSRLASEWAGQFRGGSIGSNADT